MDTDIAKARYAGLKWNSPLSEGHADDLISRLNISDGSTVVDLGCGWAELLIRAAEQTGAKGIGVDVDTNVLQRGRETARKAGAPNVTLVEQQADSWHGLADTAICIGSSHALGGTDAMLSRLAEIVPHGGRVLVGDMCWEKPPSKEAHVMFGDDVPSLHDLVKSCRRAGWMILHLSTADQREWDIFESGHRAGLRGWIVANPNHKKVEEIRVQQNEREDQYLTVYRGVLGFVYLVLARCEVALGSECP